MREQSRHRILHVIYLLITTVQAYGSRHVTVRFQLGHLLWYGHADARDIRIDVAFRCATSQGEREYISIRIGTHSEKHCSFFFCLLTAQAKALPIRKQRTHCVLLRYTASKYVLFVIYIYFCFTYMSLNTFSSCCSIWIFVQFYNSCKNENKE